MQCEAWQCPTTAMPLQLTVDRISVLLHHSVGCDMPHPRSCPRALKTTGHPERPVAPAMHVHLIRITRHNCLLSGKDVSALLAGQRPVQTPCQDYSQDSLRLQKQGL